MNQEFFFHKSLVESLPDMVWAFDSNFKLVIANAAFLDMRNDLYGHQLNIGDDIFSHVTEEAKQRWKPRYEKILNGERIIEEDTRILNGVNVTRRLSLNPVYNDQKEIIGCMGITFDISIEQSLQAKLTEVEEKYQKLMHALNQQIKQPLTNFFSLSSQLLDVHNFNQADQSTMVFLINEELAKIAQKLQELKLAFDKNQAI